MTPEDRNAGVLNSRTVIMSSVDPADWLDGAFSAGDLLMVSVLLRLRMSASWTSTRSWPPMAPLARPGRAVAGRSPRNWRSTPGGRLERVNMC